MKKIVVALVLSVSLTILCTAPSAQGVSDVTPSEVVQAGVDGLAYFLERLPKEVIVRHGFSSKEELSQATVAEPFRVHTITPDKITGYNEDIEFSSLISATTYWLVPLISRGEAKTMLTVKVVKGELLAVAIGGAQIARELALIRKKWPSSDGYEHKLVRIYPAISDFVVLSKEARVKIVPLRSAAVALELGEPVEGTYGLYDPTEIVSKLTPFFH
jgi:hypothetical protein